MAVPILLVTGYLGAGKTTTLNNLLTAPHGQRLAVLVNDFGAIDIDAGLLATVADGVISLKNGCICCSLQGDMLRALSVVLRRDPAPDGIVIETSGVSDPAEIVRTLLDPVVWREATLDAVLCLADARYLTDRPSLMDEPLFRSQLGAADFVALNKTDLVSAAELVVVRNRLAEAKPAAVIHDVQHGRVPPELTFSAAPYQPGSRFTAAAESVTPAFQSISWTASRPLQMVLFQRVISRFAASLVRVKGVVSFASDPHRPMLFQLVGDRATIVAAPAMTQPGAARLVFIAETGALDQFSLVAALEGCVSLERTPIEVAAHE